MKGVLYLDKMDKKKELIFLKKVESEFMFLESKSVFKRICFSSNDLSDFSLILYVGKNVAFVFSFHFSTRELNLSGVSCELIKKPDMKKIKEALPYVSAQSLLQYLMQRGWRGPYWSLNKHRPEDIEGKILFDLDRLKKLFQLPEMNLLLEDSEAAFDMPVKQRGWLPG